MNRVGMFPSDGRWSLGLARLPAEERSALEWGIVYCLAEMARAESPASAYIHARFAGHLGLRGLKLIEEVA